MASASKWPSQTATRQSTTLKTVLAPACSHSLRCASSRVCRLKEEKVVYPPQKPPIKKLRHSGLTSHRPSGAVNEAKSPIRNEPLTFTISVPHGNVGKRLAIKPEAQKRTSPPAAL